MKKKLVIFFALVSLVVFFACKQEPPTTSSGNVTSGNPFVGSWVDEYNMLKFVFTDNYYSSSTKECYLYVLEGNSEILLESYCYKITGNNTCEYSCTTSSGLDDYYFYFTLKGSTLYCYSNFYEDMVETSEVIFHKQ
ncbi:MAG: hypothetical protein IJA53_07985 [Spirochaetaceae bacterium]|nr:hypothetical protein [Spirochaetaceae bacterium]